MKFTKIKNQIKDRLERCPRFYLGLLRLKRTGHWSKKWIVSPDSDITIEGYPRSGNSFAHSAFRDAQGKARHLIATHVHSYTQIVRSVELGRPTMVLLRNPQDACLSFVALSNEIEGRELSEALLQHARTELVQHLENYRIFYERVLAVADGVIIAEFSLVTSDFGEVIRRVNLKFGTDFKLYKNSEANDESLFKRGGFHLSPNQQRDSIKSYLSKCFESETVLERLKAAETVYEQVLELERQQAENFKNNKLLYE